MNNFGRICIFMMLLCAATVPMISVGCSTAERPVQRTQPEKPLDVVIEEFNQALRHFDLSFLDAFTTGGYQHSTGGAAPMPKETWLNYLRAEKNNVNAGSLVYDTLVIEESTADYYEDAAFVTGKVMLTGSRNGERLAQTYRTSQLWVVDDGTWKRAGYHETRIR